MPKLLRVFLAAVIIAILTLPATAQKHYREGLEAYYAGKLDEAIAFFKKEVDKEKDTGKLATHSSFLLGVSYYKNKQYPEAIQYLKRAIDIYKQGMHAYLLGEAWYYWLGRAYYENGQYQEAASWLKRAAENADMQPSKKYDGAPKIPDLEIWKKYYIPLVPSQDICYYWQGRALYSGGQYQEAIGALAKSIELNPKGAAPDYALVAASLCELKKYDEAIAAVNKSLELGAKASTYMVLGSILREKGETAGAVNAYQKAIGLNPDYVDAYLNIASLHMSEERYRAAEEILKKAPATPLTGINLSLSLMASGKYDEAIALNDDEIKKWLSKGVGISATMVDKYPVVSSLWPSFPAQKEGIKVGDRIISINNRPTRGLDGEAVAKELNPPAGTRVTLAVERKGEKKSLNFVLTSVELINTSAAANYGIKSLLEGITGKLEEAGRDAGEAFRLNPENLWARRAVSFLRLTKGEPVSGEEMTETLNWLSGSEENLDRIFLALAYSKKGEPEQAARTFASIPEEYIQAQNAFRADFSKRVLAALKPYVDSKKEDIKANESAGKLREALDGYAEIIKLSSAEEASQIRKHIGQLIKGTSFITDVPEEARKYIIRAEVLSEKKEFNRAVEEYERAKQIAPFYPEIYKSMALAYETLKGYRLAIRNMNAYLELYPEAPDSREAKDRIIKWEFLLEEQKK